MDFGDVPASEASGAILVHTLRLARRTLKKGRILTDDDVRALIDSGIERVTVARPLEGEVREDDAASAVARRLAGDGLRAAPAFTGRANVFADAAGLLLVDRAAIDHANRATPEIGTATLAPFTRVERGQMVATVKVMPFAVASDVVTRTIDVLDVEPRALSIARFAKQRVALFQTRPADAVEDARAVASDKLIERTESVLRERVESVGSVLVHAEVVSHRAEELGHALARLGDAADVILVVGASAVVDRRDVVPTAFERSGATIVRFGMPVEPGNLLLLARKGDQTMIGLPGCARSPKLNGFDFVFERLAARLPVAVDDIAMMGVGGLLARDRRAVHAGSSAEADVWARPRVHAILLAAGRSSRMSGENKLLARVGEATVIDRVLDALVSAPLEGVHVVTGHDASRLGEIVGRRAASAVPVTVVHNPTYADGMASSLRAGLAHVPPSAHAVLVCLGDLPKLTATHVERLLAAFDPVERPLCVPTHGGVPGHPVLFSSRYFLELATLEGDVGARRVLDAHAAHICEVEVSDDGILVDVDTREALDEVRASLGSPAQTS